MEFIKLLLDADRDDYSYKTSSSIAMNILGVFLMEDVRCKNYCLFKEWVQADKEDPNR